MIIANEAAKSNSDDETSDTAQGKLWANLYFEEYLAAFFMVVVVFSVIWGVFTRYVTSSPAQWTSELASIAFAWCVFIGASAGFRRGAHSSVDIILKVTSPKVSSCIQVLADLITLLTLGVLTYLSTTFAIEAHGAVTTVLRLPQSFIYAAAATGFFLMSLSHINSAMRRHSLLGDKK